MPKYTVTVCIDVPSYGSLDIEADNQTAAIEQAKARLRDPHDADVYDDLGLQDEWEGMHCVRLTEVSLDADDVEPSAIPRDSDVSEQLDIPVDMHARREAALSFSRRDTALLLAGLRLLQRNIPDPGFCVVPEAIAAILEDADADNCTAEEIDRLCYRINEPDSYNPEDPAPPAQDSETPAALDVETLIDDATHAVLKTYRKAAGADLAEADRDDLNSALAMFFARF